MDMSYMLSAVWGLPNHVFGIIIACIVVTLIAVLIIIVLAVRANKRKDRTKKAPKVVVRDGVRYSHKDTFIEVNGNVNVTHNRGDVAIAKGKLYTANRSRNSALLPGKYTILTTAQAEEKFNVRLGRYLREYTHGDTIVIPEGETIICTSHSLLLR